MLNVNNEITREKCQKKGLANKREGEKRNWGKGKEI